MTTLELSKKYGAVYTPPIRPTASPQLQTIAQKYGATINQPQPSGMFAGTKSILSELKADPLSLKAKPSQALGNAFNAIKTSLVSEKQRISDFFSSFGKTKGAGEEIGKGLEVVAGAGHILFSPISAFFEGANQIPILGSVSKLVTLPFAVAGEAGAGISGGIVDALPLSQTTKDQIKGGVQEVTALAAQLAMGRAIGLAKRSKLEKTYGVEDAKTIERVATELAKKPELSMAEKVAPKVKGVVIEKPLTKALPDDLAPLAKEARKYKSAEEFVKNKITKFDDLSLPAKMAIQAEARVKMTNFGKTIEEVNPFKTEWLKKTETLENLKVKNADVFTDKFTLRGSKTTGRIIVDKDGIVIDGNNRLREAFNKGDKTIDIFEEITNKTKSQLTDIYTQATKGVKVPEIKPRGLATTLKEQTIERDIKADFGELPQYQTRTMKPKEALDFVNKNFDEAKRIVNGEINPTQDLLVGEIYSAMKIKALNEADIKTLMFLKDAKANDIATAFGREVKAFDANIEADPVRALRDIEKVRQTPTKTKSFKKELKTSKKVVEAIKKSSISKLAKFIEELKC